MGVPCVLKGLTALPIGTISSSQKLGRYSTGMPNLYFCQPHAKNQGMLRAVLSVEECDRVITPKSVTYVGEQFPAPINDAPDSQDFAVLRVAPGETSRRWRLGYYRSNSDLADLNEALRKLER